MNSDREVSVLKERARVLAKAISPPVAAVAPLYVIAFQVAAEQYAIETTWVKQVCPLKSLTPVPHTAPFLVGVTNLRGRVVQVVDLKKFFGMPETGLSDSNRLVVIARETIVAGILADQVLCCRLVDLAELTTEMSTHAGIRAQYLRGVTPEGLILLDGAKLIADRLLGFGQAQNV